MAAKRGNPNWVKGGPSPNPGGRSRAADELRQRLEALSLEPGCVEGLRELMASEDERIRLDTRKFIIEHVKGKPSQETTIVDGGESVSVEDQMQQLEQLRARYPELLTLQGSDAHEDA